MSPVAAAPAPQRIPRRSPPGVGAPGVDAPGVSPRHLRLVDPAARRRERRRRWLVRVWALGIVVAALAGVMVHAFMAEAQMRVGRVEQQTKIEQDRYQAVRLQVARLDSPSAVVTRALSAGLVAAPTTRVVLANGRGDRGSPEARATQPWQTAKPALGSNR